MGGSQQADAYGVDRRVKRKMTQTEKLLDQLLGMNHHLIEQLDELTEEQINDFLVQREAIIEQLRQANSEPAAMCKHEDAIRAVLSGDERIAVKLRSLVNEATDGLKRMRMSKQQSGAYATGYTQDSHFFDSKK